MSQSALERLQRRMKGYRNRENETHKHHLETVVQIRGSITQDNVRLKQKIHESVKKNNPGSSRY